MLLDNIYRQLTKKKEKDLSSKEGKKCNSYKSVMIQIYVIIHLFERLDEFMLLNFSVDSLPAYSQQAGCFGLVPVGLVEGLKDLLRPFNTALCGNMAFALKMLPNFHYFLEDVLLAVAHRILRNELGQLELERVELLLGNGRYVQQFSFINRDIVKLHGHENADGH